MGKNKTAILNVLRATARKAADEASGFGSELKDMGKGTLKNPWNPAEGMKDIQRKRAMKEIRAKIAENPTFRKGVQPKDVPGFHTLKGKGVLGTDVYVVKKGQSYGEIVPAQGTVGGNYAEYYDVSGSPVSVINTREGLLDWITDNSDRYLMNSTWWAERGHPEHYLFDTDNDPGVGIGIVITPYVAIALDEDQYEVIQPAFAVVNLFKGRATKLASMGLLHVAEAPSELAEHGRELGEKAKEVLEIIEGVHELMESGESSSASDALFLMEFHPTRLAPTPVTGRPTVKGSVECTVSVKRKSDKGTAAGVKIADLAGTVSGMLS